MGNFLLNHWMAALGTGSATIALIGACFFIPTLGPILSALLTPIASAIGNWLALWLSDLATGLRLMLSSVAGIVFCISLFGAGVFVGDFYYTPKEVKEALADLHKNYMCQARVAHKKYVTTWYDPVTWF